MDYAEQRTNQELLEALPLGALIVDACGRVADLNREAEIILGWAVPTLEGRPIHEVLRCRDESPSSPADDCPVARVLCGENRVARGKMWIRCRDDKLKLVEYRCGPYPSEQQKKIIIAFRDLSHQRELEKDLRRLGSIADESPIAIVELNEDGNLVYANPAMMRLVRGFGFSSRARPAILPANVEKLIAQCLQRQRQVDEIEVSVGRSHYVWKLSPVAGERLVRGYGIDLTTRKQAEIKLRAAKARAEAASRVRSKFLAHMSDDLRTPIEDIATYAARLSASDLKAEDRDSAQSIQRIAESLVGMIGEILEMAALQAGKITLQASTFDFRNFVHDTAAPFVRRAEAKGLRLKITISEGIPNKVSCDYEKLEQLLNYLLANAIEFTKRGEVAVEVDRDTIRAYTVKHTGGGEEAASAGEAAYLFFAVRDTGVGISRKRQNEIFEGFRPNHGSKRRACHGLGMGLAISKQLVELMGGTIGVESEPGRGSRFWFNLPIQQDDQRAE